MYIYIYLYVCTSSWLDFEIKPFEFICVTQSEPSIFLDVYHNEGAEIDICWFRTFSTPNGFQSPFCVVWGGYD